MLMMHLWKRGFFTMFCAIGIFRLKYGWYSHLRYFSILFRLILCFLWLAWHLLIIRYQSLPRQGGLNGCGGGKEFEQESSILQLSEQHLIIKDENEFLFNHFRKGRRDSLLHFLTGNFLFDWCNLYIYLKRYWYKGQLDMTLRRLQWVSTTGNDFVKPAWSVIYFHHVDTFICMMQRKVKKLWLALLWRSISAVVSILHWMIQQSNDKGETR